MRTERKVLERIVEAVREEHRTTGEIVRYVQQRHQMNYLNIVYHMILAEERGLICQDRRIYRIGK